MKFGLFILLLLVLFMTVVMLLAVLPLEPVQTPDGTILPRPNPVILFHSPLFLFLLLLLGVSLLVCSLTGLNTRTVLAILLAFSAASALAAVALYFPALQPVLFRIPVLAWFLAACGAALVLALLRSSAALGERGVQPNVFTLRTAGIILGHLAVILVLAGAFLALLKQDAVVLRLEPGSSQPVHKIVTRSGRTIDLGFDLLVTSFKIDRSGGADRDYRATFRITTSDGRRRDLPAAVNRPAQFNGWRFYLSGFDPIELSYVVITARRDPGRNLALAGLYALLLGVAAAFYSRREAFA